MPITIEMPKLSDTMTEGTLVRWVKKVGDQVEVGDVLAEVETDKATMEMEAFDEGVLGEVYVQDGQKVQIGQKLAILLAPGEEKPGGESGGAAPAAKAKAPAPAAPPQQQARDSQQASAAIGAQEARDEDKQDEARSRTEEQVGTAAKAQPAGEPAARGEGERIKASPLARKLAAELNVDLASLTGSGPGGRIVQNDVRQASEQAQAPRPEKAAAAQTAAPAAAPAPSKGPSPAPQPLATTAEDKRIPLTGMRRAIASRLLESKTTIPHFYLQAEINADPLVKLRQELNTTLENAGQPKLTVNDFILKATAIAATRVPQANAAFEGESVVQFANVQLACAVAVEDGLVTPVIRQAQTKSIGRISAEVKDLAGKARSKKLKPEDYQGGTITVSNLGGYGVEQFFAIINPPQSLIVSVGTILKKPVVADDGSVGVGQRMVLGISCDHRVVDGAIGAQFLAELKKLLENPVLLLV
ncbi:MAG: pyruvate dehydrogenase complex dihydrolipoamide acetyltransferase [Verrucomicrobia bacterium]|nr:pyruvate dehydrogenase complex dihydrolipoamide acetyltransferase [Verrucomicrobiota bacterium]